MANHRAELPRIQFRQSLTRHILLKGGDRRLVIVSIMVGSYVGFSAVVAYGLWIGGAIATVMLGVLLYLTFKAGKYDPQWLDVMLRFQSYRSYYSSRGRLKAPLVTYKDW